MPDPINRREMCEPPPVDWDVATEDITHDHRDVSLREHLPASTPVIDQRILQRAIAEARTGQSGLGMVGVDREVGLGFVVAYTSSTVAIDMVLGYSEREIARRTDVVAQNMRWGVIEYARGMRFDDIEPGLVRERPGFTDGMHAAAELPRDKREGLIAIVNRMWDEGKLAVLRGEDIGDCFHERYESDPVFARGVQEARQLRMVDPAKYVEAQIAMLASEAQLAERHREIRP